MKVLPWDILKREREKNNLSGRDTAAKVGISREALRKIEDGRLIPKNIVLRGLVRIYGISPPEARHLYGLVCKERVKRSSIIRDYNDLKKDIGDMKLNKLVSKISADIIDAIRNGDQLNSLGLYKQIDEIVKKCVESWDRS